MPLLGYFVAVGLALTGLLLGVGELLTVETHPRFISDVAGYQGNGSTARKGPEVSQTSNVPRPIDQAVVPAQNAVTPVVQTPAQPNTAGSQAVNVVAAPDAANPPAIEQTPSKSKVAAKQRRKTVKAKNKQPVSPFMAYDDQRALSYAPRQRTIFDNGPFFFGTR
jgi:hypothetical protein